jgi:hypothetical protein
LIARNCDLNAIHTSATPKHCQTDDNTVSPPSIESLHCMLLWKEASLLLKPMLLFQYHCIHLVCSIVKYTSLVLTELSQCLCLPSQSVCQFQCVRLKSSSSDPEWRLVDQVNKTIPPFGTECALAMRRESDSHVATHQSPDAAVHCLSLLGRHSA